MFITFQATFCVVDVVGCALPFSVFGRFSFFHANFLDNHFVVYMKVKY